MSSPPPPYTLQPPPAYIISQKRPARSSRQSSRQTLSKALQRARHAVQLDSSGSDIPSAIAAYNEAIELLQWVIARRSRKPENEAEVERVVSIVSLPPQFFLFPFSIPAVALCRKAALFILCPGHSLVSHHFIISMTDMLTVYASCVAPTVSPYRVM
jgi:hypothetical protein